jgi:Zn-dependent protease
MKRPRAKISIFSPIIGFITTVLWALLFMSSLVAEGSAPIVPIFFGAVTVMNLFEAIKNLKRYRKEKNEP